MTKDQPPEDLKPGSKRSWTRTISDSDILRFAELSGDKGRHHTERDERGRLVAHGLLTATLPTKLGSDWNYIARTMEFDFVKLVRSGDVLTCVGTIVGVIVQSARFKVRFSFEVVDQNGVLVMKGTSSGQVPR